MAIVAFAAFVAGVVSDDTNGSFWARHTLLASLVASVIVVMLSLGVINDAIERRRRRRWSVLAQYIMYESVRNARMIWSGVLEVARLLSTEPNGPAEIEAGARVVHDSSRLTSALRDVISDEGGRRRLDEEVAFFAEHSDEVLGRWAAVMPSAKVYAEVIDRHVELAGDLAWIGAVLDGFRDRGSSQAEEVMQHPARADRK